MLAGRHRLELQSAVGKEKARNCFLDRCQVLSAGTEGNLGRGGQRRRPEVLGARLESARMAWQSSDLIPEAGGPRTTTRGTPPPIPPPYLGQCISVRWVMRGGAYWKRWEVGGGAQHHSPIDTPSCFLPPKKERDLRECGDILGCK